MKNPAEMMTIQQLNCAIDSLRKSIDTTQIKFSEANIHLSSKRILLDDSTKRITTAPDVLFDKLKPEDKIKAIAHAKESSRRIKETMERQQDEILGREKYLARHKIEWHRKFFLAVVCFVLFFIGAPLGAIIRKGGIGIPTLIALGFFILYQLLTMVGENMAKKGFLEPWIGMWMSTMVLLPISIWLTYKATKEAALLDSDSYRNKLKKVIAFFSTRNKKVAL